MSETVYQIVWTVDFGDFLLTGNIRKNDLGYCLIATAHKIGLEGGL